MSNAKIWKFIDVSISDYIVNENPTIDEAKKDITEYLRMCQDANMIWNFGVFFAAARNTLKVEVTFPGDPGIYARDVQCRPTVENTTKTLENHIDAYERAMRGI